MSFKKLIIEALREARQKPEHEQMLDALLDKVGQLGVEGLTPAEKHLLDVLSGAKPNNVDAQRANRYEEMKTILGRIRDEDVNNPHSPVDVTQLFDENNIRFAMLIFDGNEIKMGVGAQFMSNLEQQGWRKSEIAFALKRIIKEEIGIDVTRTVQIRNI